MVTELNEIYKCSICGNIVEVAHSAQGGGLECCGQPMRLLKANAIDASKEKHVPVVTQTATGTVITVGSIPHPMDKEHYIEFIELLADGKCCKKFLKPGEKPVAEFGSKPAKWTARAYCNQHGLWKS